MILFILLGLLIAGEDTPRDRDLAWVMAYSDYVRMKCPGWEQDRSAFDRLFPFDGTLGPRWAEQGDLNRAMLEGGRAVEKAAATDPTFCAVPWKARPEHAKLIARVLHRSEKR